MTERPVFVPSPDGVRDVLDRARSRRRRRVALAAAVTAAAAAIGGVIAVVPDAGAGADRLRVVPASPAPESAPVTTPRALPSSSTLGRSSGPSIPGSSAQGTPPTPPSGRPATAESPTPTAPTLRRSASAPISRTSVGYDSDCDATNDIVGWCVVYTGPSSARRKHPVQLSIELCRPQVNGDATIHFSDRREIDLELLDAAGSKQWQAGQGIRYRSPGAAVVVRAGTCLRWVSSWDTIAPNGFYAPPGSYSVSYAIDSSDVGGSYGGPTLQLTD